MCITVELAVGLQWSFGGLAMVSSEHGSSIPSTCDKCMNAED